MAAPIYHSADTTTFVDSTALSTITLTYPANIAAGDLLVIFARFGSTGGNSTVPTGWTQLNRTKPALSSAHQVLYRIADSALTGTFDWVLSSGYRSLATIIRISGLNTGTISDVLQTSLENIDPGAVDASAWSSENVLYVANVTAQNTDYTFAPPTNYSTDAFNVVHDPTNNNLAFVRMAFGFRSGVGANEDPDTWTASGGSTPEYSITSLLAIRGTSAARWGFRITDIKKPNVSNELETGVSTARVLVWLDGDDTTAATEITNQSITTGAMEVELPSGDDTSTPVVAVLWGTNFFWSSVTVVDLDA